MRHKRNRYIKSILITLLSVLLTSCSDDSVITTGENPVVIVHTPMWPQSGYNAQNTSSPYAPYAHCNPVNLGEVEWYYDFGNYGSDGAEFCVDSKNNIYFFSQQEPAHKLYKFRSNGTVIWIADSLNSFNHAYVSLSPNETKIYFNIDNGLYCYDSSGNFVWKLTDYSMYPKPSIGKDGTIYTAINQKAAAVNPNGSIKWISNEQVPYIAVYFVLDRDENIYIAGDNIKKIDKNGITVWTVYPDSSNFLSLGIVIDGFGNLYFTNYRSGALLYSMTNDGQLRWKSQSASISIPVIGEFNSIYTVGLTVQCYDTTGANIWTKPMPAGVFFGESPTIDDYGNIYFITDSPIKAISYSKNGDFRWMVDIFNMPSLPKPSLMPMGRMLVAPKRADKIACIK